MKLAIAFIILFCISNIQVIAQSPYKEFKKKFDHRTYSYLAPDKYNPVLAGVASYIIPGVGHFYCNENKRGTAFLSGYVGGILVMASGVVTASFSNDAGEVLLVGGALCTVGLQIWSSVDAVRVAKVKNLEYRARPMPSVSFFLKPERCISGQQSLSLAVGFRF